MKTLLIFLSLIFSAGLLLAQEPDIDFNKEDFKSKDDYKMARDYVRNGNEMYIQGKGGLRNALEFYLKAYQLNPNHATLNLVIGNCYLFSIQKVKCIEYYKKAYQLNPMVSDSILFVLARGYHLNMEWDKAIEYYGKYKNGLSPDDLQRRRPEIEKKIEECKYGKELVQSPVRAWIDNCGPNVNSSYADYSPLISTDESMMMFTSRRPDTYGGKTSPEDGVFYEDIYLTYNNGNGWEPCTNVGKPLNTDDHDATVGLSPDGQKLFIYKGNVGGGDIFVSELKGSEWTKPDALPRSINSDDHEGSASFSYNGKTMYFDSNRKGGYGDHDIYMSFLDEKERWGAAKNMGAAINTPYDDRCPFMHPDGRTMYFSSKGHKTMGGFDIFKTTLNDDGTWSEPENMGYPINTPDDDVLFVINASGSHGYYSSIKEEGIGDYDIYMVTIRGPEKPGLLSNEDQLLANTAPVTETVIEETVEIKTMRLTILKGTVKDAITLQPVEAQIEIVDNEKNEVISTAVSNSVTGKFLISLPSGKNYGIAVKATDYLFHSENFDIPATTNYQEVNKEILLDKMAVGSKVILKNIFFDYAKATLRPESFAELDRLVKLLNDYPTVRVEISGHTDSKGSKETNQKLSNNRAKAVVDYMITKGIAAGRLEYKGYDFQQPIASNDTDEGRQQNRRVEFKILSK